MSIAEHQRLKLLELTVLDLVERVKSLEDQRASDTSAAGGSDQVFLQSGQVVVKRGPGRPPKAKDGH